VLVCGLKISHDAGVAVISDNRLLFSIEIEKLDNNPRYSSLVDLCRIAEVLATEGIATSDVDQFVVDGWWTEDAYGTSVIRTLNEGVPTELPVAPYLDGPGPDGAIRRYLFHDHDFAAPGRGYASYNHVTNHVLGAYCSSPFAARYESAMILAWDGGMVPHLYQVNPHSRTVTAVSALLPITGNCFAEFSSRFGPFRIDPAGLSEEELLRCELSIAGKAMAYAALGEVTPSAFPVFDAVMRDFITISAENARIFSNKIAANRDELLPGLSDADLIASFQAYLGQLLVSRLSSLLRRRFPGQRPYLAYAGGCALNIKWNSMLRSSELFEDIWVPPFPNDSGAAIGTACCEMFRGQDSPALDWNVYGGPSLLSVGVPDGWASRPCNERQLAELLHTEGEPVVVLSGRAELGPRALGNRSILAPATSAVMKDRLNVIKGRAGYRPIAPICLSALSSDVFVPGSDDPYMLFEHRLRDGWADRIPAIVHLDGTARLQTIDLAADSVTARILAAYVEISGIPVLCNTSANFNSRGFFPDVASAAKWGGTRYIWSAGALYINPQALDSLQDRWECMAQNRLTEGKGSAAETSVDEVEEIVGQIFAKVLASRMSAWMTISSRSGGTQSPRDG